MPQYPGWTVPHTGGGVVFSTKRISFYSHWEKDVDNTKICLEASFSFKIDNDSTVNIICDKLFRKEHNQGLYGSVSIRKMVNIDIESLYDAERFITVEAELKVVHEDTIEEERS